MRLALACAVAHVVAIGSAQADVGERPWRGGFGAGGSLAVTGPATTGMVAEAELYPGGALGRWGVRMEARSVDPDLGEADAGIVAGGVTYEAAASRPRLAIALYGVAGSLVPDARAVAGGGVHTQLWLVGPLALGLDSGALVLFAGVDTEVILSGALTVRLAR